MKADDEEEEWRDDEDYDDEEMAFGNGSDDDEYDEYDDKKRGRARATEGASVEEATGWQGAACIVVIVIVDFPFVGGRCAAARPRRGNAVVGGRSRDFGRTGGRR